MKYKIVQFRDGRYGVRSWWFGYGFMDLHDSNLRWTSQPNINRWCKGTREEVQQMFDTFTDKGTPV